MRLKKRILCRMIQIMDRFVEEKIKSDKVVEGVLKDICCGVNSIADTLGSMNIRDEMIYTINERDIMAGYQGKGQRVPEAAVGGGENKAKTLEQQGGESAEKLKSDITKLKGLRDIVGLLKEDYTELVFISEHLRLMNESLQGIMMSVSSMSIRITNMMERAMELYPGHWQQILNEPEVEKVGLTDSQIAQIEQGGQADQEKS